MPEELAIIADLPLKNERNLIHLISELYLNWSNYAVVSGVRFGPEAALH